MRVGRRRFALAAGGGLVALVLIELGFRLFATHLGVDVERIQALRTAVLEDQLYELRAHPYTLYTRRAGANEWGFRDAPWTLERLPDTRRVLCLGSATTEAEHDPRQWAQAYPSQLEALLNETGDAHWEVMNAGMAGWTSAETLAAWFLTLRDFAPDVVVLHHGATDADARNQPDFAPDYAHFVRPLAAPRRPAWTRFLVRFSDLAVHWLVQPDAEPLAYARHALVGPSVLERNGELAPESAHSLRRNIASIGADAARRGARVVLLTMPSQAAGPSADDRERARALGIPEHNHILRELADENGWQLAEAAPEAPEQTTASNRSKAERVRTAILASAPR